MRIRNEIYRVVLLVLAFGAAAYAVYAEIVVSALPDWCVVLCSALGFFFASFFVKLFHELGHFLFGLLAGMRPQSVRIGCLVWRRTGGFSLSPFDGFGACEMSLKRPERVAQKYFLLTFGGLFSSLLVLALCCIFFFRGGTMHYLIGMGFPTALYLLLFNGMPMTTASGDTDGKVLADLLRKAPEAVVALHVLSIQAELYESSPANIDPALYFEVPVIREDDRNFAILTRLRYLRYLDAGDRENALKQNFRLRDLIVYLSDEDLEEIYDQMLYDCCVLEDNPDGAAALFDRQESHLLSLRSATGYRILAAYHAKYGSEETANRYRAMGLSALAREEYGGIRAMEERLLRF